MKRAPKASVKRKVFEVEGPGVADAVPLDVRARAIFEYFKKYNYEVRPHAGWRVKASNRLCIVVSELDGRQSDTHRLVANAWRLLPPQVKERGDVITFVGNYAASKGQAAALVLYVFFGELHCAAWPSAASWLLPSCTS